MKSIKLTSLILLSFVLATATTIIVPQEVYAACPADNFISCLTSEPVPQPVDILEIEDISGSDSNKVVIGAIGSAIRGLATFVLTGSINPTASTAVVGVGTLFTTELRIGDRITVSGETRTVSVITDALNLTVTVAFTDVGDDITPDALPAPLRVENSAGVLLNMIQDDGDWFLEAGTLFIKEQADDEADLPGYGQISVNAATPNELYFTDDVGTRFQIGGLSAVAGKITVNDTTDTTAFPVLVGAATGDQLTLTDASGLTYNATTGVLTSVFSGNLTGDVTGAATQLTVADTADTTTFPVLVGAATGNELTLTDAALTYNAGTGELGSPMFQFPAISAPTHSEGLLYYDTDDKALTYYNESATVAINIGQESVVRARNASGVAISDGEVVYVSGSTGTDPQITLAIASADTPMVLGVATQDIANNTFGYVTTHGIVRGIDTNAFTAGDTLYLSGSVAGAFVITAPTLPIETVMIAIVITKSVGAGRIFVNPENVYLRELVDDPSPSINSDGAFDILGPAGANNIVEIQAATGRVSALYMAGDDMSQPVTTLQPADVYMSLLPFHSTAGGFNLTGISSNAAISGAVIHGIIGVADPADTVSAFQVRCGKSDGAVSMVDLADAETCWQLSDSTGADDFLTITGGGYVTFLAPGTPPADTIIAQWGTGDDAARITFDEDGDMVATSFTGILQTSDVAAAFPIADSISLVTFGTDKEMRIDVGAVTDSTVRVLTMPDADIDLTVATGDYATAAEGDLAATAVQPADITGKQTLWIPAASMTPSITNGAAATQSVETTAGRPDMVVQDFDATTEEHSQFDVAFPNQWNLGTITFSAYHTTAAGRTGGLDGVVWGLQCVAVSADDTIDVAYGTEVVVGTDAAQTEEDLWVTAESAAVTIAGTPADADMTFCQISRVVGSSSPIDDMDIDARLVGIKIFYTTDALNDD